MVLFRSLLACFLLKITACWVNLHAFLPIAYFFNIKFFQKFFQAYHYHQIIKRFGSRPLPSDNQTVWIKNRPDILSGLILILTDCKGWQKLWVFSFWNVKLLKYCMSFYRLAPVLITIFHQYVISYTRGQSYSDGSVLEQSHQSKTGYKYMIWHIDEKLF